MLFSLLLVAAGASAVLAGAGPCPRAKCGAAAPPNPGKSSSFDTLVTFGDSYTDNGRLGYYINNGGKAPPPGQLQTESTTTASGGLNWAQYAARAVNASLVDYAVSGATCSNKLVSRYFAAIKAPFPSVLDDEIPSFEADVNFKSVFPKPRTADGTVYALWIGTNDLGYGGFLSDSQAPGTTISDYVECVWAVLDAIYKNGGRRFVLLNTAPLELAPLYAPAAANGGGGTLDSQFWANKTAYNVTEYAFKIKEYTTSVNKIFAYGVPFQVVIKSRWPGAMVDVFDVHSLIMDIVASPKTYLDAPYNVTGYWHHCLATNSSVCVDQTALGPRSGFLWYDELHPSDKTDSVIASNFVDVVAGKSKYGTRYTSSGWDSLGA